MPADTAAVHIDGAARGNPGPAAYALTLVRPGQPPVEEAEPMGTATNNVAEYTALVRALEVAAELGVRALSVFSDSELMVKQMAGEYRVKHPDLQPLHQQASALRKRFDRVTITHVRRADNKRADFLCNEALDGRPRRRGQESVHEGTAPPTPAPAAGGGAKPPAGAGRPAPESLEQEAVALFNACRASWAAGKEGPTAVDVWDRLWAMLGEHGVLRGPR